MVEPWGLAGDRRWMLVDATGEAVTAREHREMLLVHPRLRADGGLGRLRAGPGRARGRRARPATGWST